VFKTRTSRHKTIGIRDEGNESLGGLSCLCLGNVFGLGTLLSLNDFELNVIAFLQALVAFRLDGAVVDEHIRAIFPANKAEALRVVKPFHFAFDSRHDPYSEPSWKAISWTVFFWASKLLEGVTQNHSFSGPSVFYHNFGFAGIFA
jgi:hypothetical protein